MKIYKVSLDHWFMMDYLEHDNIAKWYFVSPEKAKEKEAFIINDMHNGMKHLESEISGVYTFENDDSGFLTEYSIYKHLTLYNVYCRDIEMPELSMYHVHITEIETED